MSVPGDLFEPRRETLPAAIPAEGARVGVATCLACGAALLIDPRDDFDVVELHRRWHEEHRPAAAGERP